MKRGWVLLLFLLAPLGNAANHARPANASCDEPLPQVFERVSPAVVFMSVVSIDPFKVTIRVSMGLGSGFVIGANGLMPTNSHVVFGTQAIVVMLDDGTRLVAKLAEEIGRSVEAASHLERDISLPNFEMLERLAEKPGFPYASFSISKTMRRLSRNGRASWRRWSKEPNH